MDKALSQLNSNNDTTITMDVFKATFAKNKRIEMLNFSMIKKAMQLTQNLLDSKYETHNQCGLKTAFNILKAFQQQIISTK
jgi:hypothetical protein